MTWNEKPWMNTNIYFHMGSVFSIDYYFCQLNDVDGCDIPPETNTKKKEYRIFNGKYNHVLRTVSLFSSRDNELPKTKSYFRYNNNHFNQLLSIGYKDIILWITSESWLIIKFHKQFYESIEEILIEKHMEISIGKSRIRWVAWNERKKPLRNVYALWIGRLIFFMWRSWKSFIYLRIEWNASSTILSLRVILKTQEYIIFFSFFIQTNCFQNQPQSFERKKSLLLRETIKISCLRGSKKLMFPYSASVQISYNLINIFNSQ